MCSECAIAGKVKSDNAPSARIAAIAKEESSSSASIAPLAAMIAETPQIAEPWPAANELRLQLEKLPRHRHGASESVIR